MPTADENSITMAFKIKRGESVTDGLKRIAGEQIERAIEEIDACRLDGPTKVHQVRKRCKKLRGLLRMVRPVIGKTYKLENASHRDTARLLSELRDANIALQTFKSLLEGTEAGEPRFQSIGERLRQDQNELTDDGPHTHMESALQAVRQRLVAARERVAQWTLKREGFDALSGGWQRTYAKARRALRQAQEQRTAEALHRWRKEVKYHGYQCRLLEAVWPALLEARSDEAARLGDWLGEDHDLAVLRQQLLEPPPCDDDGEAVATLVRRLDRRRQRLQRRCFRLGKKLFAEDKRSFVRRYERYWQAWHKR